MQQLAQSAGVGRLKQVQGQTTTVHTSIGAGRFCLERAQQRETLESVSHNVKCERVQHHMEHCSGKTILDGGICADQALGELEALPMCR